jgi:hypothetical protein
MMVYVGGDLPNNNPSGGHSAEHVLLVERLMPSGKGYYYTVYPLPVERA